MKQYKPEYIVITEKEAKRYLLVAFICYACSVFLAMAFGYMLCLFFGPVW